MAAIAFTINGKAVSVDVEPDTPLLWVIREHLKLTGTKFGCGIAQCGACTVHLDGEPTRSCSVQSGQIMQAAALLQKNPRPTRDQIIAHMDGNICR